MCRQQRHFGRKRSTAGDWSPLEGDVLEGCEGETKESLKPAATVFTVMDTSTTERPVCMDPSRYGRSGMRGRLNHAAHIVRIKCSEQSQRVVHRTPGHYIVITSDACGAAEGHGHFGAGCTSRRDGVDAADQRTIDSRETGNVVDLVAINKDL